jgi:hypothetical protein
MNRAGASAYRTGPRPAAWRRLGVALALLALIVQAMAPVAVAPPAGQPVHFAHAHHGEHQAHHAGAAQPSQPDDGACPVCKALQAAGAGIHAPAPVLVVAEQVATPLAPRIETQPRRAPAIHGNGARAPPLEG